MLFTQWQQVNNNLTTKPFKNEHKTIFYILCTHTYSLFCKYYTRKYIYNKYTEKIVDLSKYKLYKSICSILLCTLICIEKTNFLQHISSYATRIYPSIYYKVFKSTSILLGGYLNTIRPTTEVHFAGVFSDRLLY